MVLPEDPAPRDSPKRPPRAPLIGATLLILAISIFALGSLTAPDTTAESISSTTTEPPLAQPTTTTTQPNPNTFRIVDIQQGHQLWWGRGFNPPNSTMAPIQIVELDSEILLFGSEDHPRAPSGIGGLHLWVSEDGTFWSDQGEVIGSEHRVTRIIPTEQGLTALTQNGVVLSSNNGRSWTAERLPLPANIGAEETAHLWNAATGSGRTVVFGQVTIDAIDLLRRHLPEDAAALLAEGYNWGVGGRKTILIHGPWGLAIRVVDLEEEAVLESVVDALTGDNGGRPFVWVRDGVGEWKLSEFEGDWVDSISIAEDGTITIIGFGNQGEQRWTSSDGESWGTNSRPSIARGIQPWNDGYVATRHAPTDLVVSPDGETWQSVNIGDSFPTTIDWWIHPLVASEDGVAAFINGQRPNLGNDHPEVSVEKDGYRLTADHSEGRIELSRVRDDVSFFRFTMWSGVISDDIEVDLTNRTYTFHDPATGEALVVFTFEELEAAERDQGVNWRGPDFALTGLLYSHDGETWTIQDVTEWFGDEWVTTALVTDDRVVAVTTSALPGGEPDINIRIGIIQRRGDDSSG